MGAKTCRWGFLSTASIGRKNWQAVVDAGNAQVTAVASRSVEGAARFIDECQSVCPQTAKPMAMGSYQELIDSPEVDAVYLPIPTGMRKEWVLKCAAAGKHVLIEKPAANSAADLQEMISACAEARVQLMDGTMFMHNQRLRRMREVIDSGAIGEVRRITAQFSFHGDEDFRRTNIRTHSELEPMGALGDLGWYTSRFILWAMNWQMPQSLSARTLSTMQHPDSPGTVPAELSAEMVFAGGVSASMHCSFVAQHCQLAMVSGTKGYLMLRDFVLPWEHTSLGFDVLNSSFGAQHCTFTMSPGLTSYAGDEPPSNAPAAQEANMIRRFSELVIQGQTDSFWPEITLKTQLILDQCLLQG